MALVSLMTAAVIFDLDGVLTDTALHGCMFLLATIGGKVVLP